MRESVLIEQKVLREKLIGRTEVLDKVKDLIELPNIQYSTLKQVAEYYETDTKTIEKITERNEDELITDGYKMFKSAEIVDKYLNLQNVGIKKSKGFSIININDKEIKVPSRGMKLFTRRSILRVGMLLRNSEIARRIRDYLLNVEHDTKQQSPEIIHNIVAEITEEQNLQIKAMEAYTNGNLEDFAKYSMMINAIKNKRVKEIERENKALKFENSALAEGVLTLDFQSCVNKFVRLIAIQKFKSLHGEKFCFSQAWGKLYAHLLSKYSLGINKRITERAVGKKKLTLFDVLDTDSERKAVVKSCLAICEMYKIDTSEVFIPKEYILEN